MKPFATLGSGSGAVGAVVGSGVVAGGRGVRIFFTNSAYQKFAKLCHPANFVSFCALHLLPTSTLEMGCGFFPFLWGGPVDGAAVGLVPCGARGCGAG